MNPQKKKSKKNPPAGIVFLNKSPGQTSFQALGSVKKVLESGKVGHTGTLDKFAEGLLIILTGKLTRLNSVITGMDKCYEALIRFGVETDTLDPEGEIIAEAPIPELNKIVSALKLFHGEVSQTPPLYSAIHIDGKRAHEIARSGKTAEIPSRKVTFYKLEIMEYNAPDLRLKVHCSKGTYIRSLARDLALACGSRGFVQELKRTAVGPFSLDQAIASEDFAGKESFFPWENFFETLGNSQLACLSDSGLEKVKNGVPFNEAFILSPLQKNTEWLLLKDPKGNLAAVLEHKNQSYIYKVNLAPG